MKDDKQLTVFSLVGPSGSGKSTLLRELARNYPVLEEKYMELNRFGLDNTLCLSKWGYINYWFNSVLEAREVDKLLITDRCPYDTCAYVKNGAGALRTLVQNSFDDIRGIGVRSVLVLLTGDFSHLEERISMRLRAEPERLKYHEGEREHNRRAWQFFVDNERLWHYTIDSTEMTLQEVYEEVVRIIQLELQAAT